MHTKIRNSIRSVHKFSMLPVAATATDEAAVHRMAAPERGVLSGLALDHWPRTIPLRRHRRAVWAAYGRRPVGRGDGMG